MTVIAAVIGSYCHGEDIVAEVSKRLGYPKITETLIDAASERRKVNRERMLRTLSGPEPFLNRISRERQKNLACLEATLAELILPDDVIVTGCAAFLIPGNISHVLKACIIANHAYRTAQAVMVEGISNSDAEARVHEHDKQISACSNYIVEKPAYDESLFDMMIAMQDMSVDEAVENICSQAMSDAVRTTERSREAARDFLLSAKVKLALTEAGHDVSVFAESGHVTVQINEQAMRMSKLESRLKAIASELPGVVGVSTKLGPRFNPPSVNPWNRIEVPPKILLVDDEKEFVHTLSERLHTRSLESSIAYDGEQALEMLDVEVPDVIVLDLRMPGIDGIETLRRVKERHPQVEVIILTGHGSEHEQNMAEELGAFAYLQKPVDINELAQIMREAYARKSKR